MPELDAVLTLSQRMLGVMKPRPLATLHVGGSLTVDGPGLSLPPASVTTAAIQDSAVQQMIGSFAQAVDWTLPVTNVWTETPVQAQVTSTGVPTRVEFNLFLSCPLKGHRIAWGVMLNGQPPAYVLGALDSPENNFGMMASGAYYVSPDAGSGRVGIGLYGPTGAKIYPAIVSTLYVTEQKR
jgi:hypothetical protein